MNKNEKNLNFNDINSNRNYLNNNIDFSKMNQNPYNSKFAGNNTNFMKQYSKHYNSSNNGTSYVDSDFCNNTVDYEPKPFVVNINEVTKQNNTFRTVLWTGNHLQLTLMNINAGDEIGLEIHPYLDQFLRIEEGEGIVKMGDRKDRLDFQAKVSDDFAIIIPAGKWHNLINTGCKPLKLYSIYAPPQHPRGTVHETKADAEEAEKNGAGY